MINVSENLKNILRNDRFPMTDTVTPKDLQITFDGIATPIHADQMVDDSFSLTESIISDNDIRFGTCRASQIKFKLANVPEDLKGREFTIDQLIGESDVIPLGKYKVDSAKLQDDLIFKEVIAYDKFRDIDIDVSAWYNSLTFPMTLKAFRTSLLTHLGIDEIDQTLPNDDMEVTKTIEPTQISGRTVLEATVELNGAFGHINRQGKFTRIALQPNYGLYPSETLYPSEDLYPVAETDTSYTQEDIVADTVSKAMYQSVRFEEYTVKEIDKLQIRAEENDIGAIVGTGTNAYIIEGNFLVFGKTASELEQIAINAFGNMAKRPYRPYEAQSIGLSYVEVGDALQFATDDSVVGYVLQRTLTGIQALKDEFEALGSEEREQNFGVNKEIIQLQGKTAILKRTVEEVSSTLTDLAEDTESRFIQTAEEISLAVGALDEQLTGEINVLAGQVVLKVDTNGNIGYIDLLGDPDDGLTSIKLKGDNISLEGYVGINGKVIVTEDGILKAVDGEFSGKITASTININNEFVVDNGGNVTLAKIQCNNSFSIQMVHPSTGLLTDMFKVYLNQSGANVFAHLTGNYLPIIFDNGINVSDVYSRSTIQAVGTIYTDNAFVENGVHLSEKYAPKSHSHSGYASSSHTQSSYTITPEITAAGNISLLGSPNAASPPWCEATFVKLSPSDFRLKKNIQTLNLPDELFMSLKPKTFEFKCDKYNEGTVFGLLAQQVENAFEEYGYNPYVYNLIELVNPKSAYTDEGLYVNDKVHTINYNNFITWLIYMVQKQQVRIDELENRMLLANHPQGTGL